MDYKEFKQNCGETITVLVGSLFPGLCLIGAIGLARLDCNKKHSKLEQNTQNEIVIDLMKVDTNLVKKFLGVDTTDYQNQFNYLDYKK
jgi:hypothetical protein